MRPWVVAFRTNGSAMVGLGHLRRCLTLARELRTRGCQTPFVVTGGPSAGRLLRNEGIDAVLVEPADDYDLGETFKYATAWRAGLLVVDSYAVREAAFARPVVPVAAIDDRADRYLPVELVVNGAADAERVIYRTAARTKLLLGPKYILLRDEFSQRPNREIGECVQRVLVTVGGGDSEALTARLVAWTREALRGIRMDVVLGPFFRAGVVREVESQAKKGGGVTLHRNPSSIRDLMMAADLALCGGGQTTYELAAAGTPTVAMLVAQNQEGNLSGLSRQGTLIWAASAGDPEVKEKVVGSLLTLALDQQKRARMSQSGPALVDGLGAKRVAGEIARLCGI